MILKNEGKKNNKVRILHTLIITVMAWGFITPSIMAEDIQIKPQPKMLEGADTHVYRTIDGHDLRLHLFNPEGHSADVKKPAIVFFFGGGWSGGTVKQFLSQAKYLAARGMVAVLADYRVKYRHGSNPFHSVSDGQAAIRYLRLHAAKFGINPNKIVASGGSAGGHIALSTAVINPIAPVENGDILSKANALVLYNPRVDFINISKKHRERYLSNFGERFMARVEAVSPMQHVTSSLVPTMILVGREDHLTTADADVKFCDKARRLGAPHCDVVIYDHAGHGFHNSYKHNGKWFWPTLVRMSRFLEALGYIQ